MRIAHFCDSQPGRPDGVSRSAEMTVRLLRAAGHEVELYRPGPLRGPGVRSLPVPLRQVRVGLPFTPRRAEVVHAHSTGPVGMTGFRAAADWGVPLVATWHTDLLAYADVFTEVPVGAAWCALRLELGWSPREFLELTRPGAVRRRRLVELGRAMFARMAVAIAPSAKTAAGFAPFEPAAEVCVLPTPVSAVTPSTRQGPPGGAVVLSVGRGTAEKNPELLLRAFARLRVARPDARLVLLGVHQRRRYLNRRIAALGLDGHVDVHPPVPHAEVAAHYRAADVLAFTSTTDTQSLVLAEAEASGLPVVVADPGLAVRPGATEAGRFICEPEPEAFAGALLRMLDDDDLRASVIRDGLAAASAYTPEVFLRRLELIYEKSRRSLGPRRAG
ncbi:glycosyl transferase family 1 [Actinoplanes italicus]|uniref:Glycosyltransferase involved in cell wall biosynthesis n=1 Tax=Actinoplanes italicus TaxID=113567 RepID=A0A2T0KFA6_9ACTN|nr:glycosyltransferase [Actinoplanes italicus]PRX22041.1 glycosyltransferase involved in cell wall biosynthesis [Actinoplanes italicus]GIE29540.1 glycosyl transferase family 1 [Actinoplanes italicus]